MNWLLVMLHTLAGQSPLKDEKRALKEGEDILLPSAAAAPPAAAVPAAAPPAPAAVPAAVPAARDGVEEREAEAFAGEATSPVEGATAAATSAAAAGEASAAAAADAAAAAASPAGAAEGLLLPLEAREDFDLAMAESSTI